MRLARRYGQIKEMTDNQSIYLVLLVDGSNQLKIKMFVILTLIKNQNNG